MEFTKPRATLEETLEFANLVREAGGGSPLDALMPAVPQESKRCLIARNLNFNCRVDAGTDNAWYMVFEDPVTRDAVASKLSLQVLESNDNYDYALLLPDEIGQVAADFDIAYDLITADPEDITEDERQLVRDFWPYIESSVREAYANAAWVGPDGAIL